MKPGYKQTEVGVIPEDWDVEKFENVGNYFKGCGISMHDVVISGFPCIMYGDIYIKYDTYFKKCDFRINALTAEKSKKAEHNDLFFTASGETAEDIGRCVSYQGENDIFIGGDIIALRPNKKFSSLFLAYVQNSVPLKIQKASFAQGHSVVHINSKSIEKLMFARPPLPEQNKIAEALSDVDELIFSLEKLVAKKKSIKQGAMQQLLTGKKRLPGFTGEWKEIKLGQAGDIIRKSIDPQKFSSKIFREYSMPAFDTGKKPNVVTGSSMHSSRILISGEVLLFNKLNVRQKRVWFINHCEKHALCSSEFLPYVSTQISLPLLSYYLLTDEATSDFEGMSTGTSNSQKRITPKKFREYSLLVPSTKQEQDAIANTLSDMDSEIDALEQKLAKTRQLKQGMMQQLLTGKIRLI